MNLLFRKIYRLSGLTFPLIYFFSNRQTTLIWLSAACLLFLILEICRFFFPQFRRNFFESFSAILKQQEQGKHLGTTYFLLGSLLTVIFFTKSIAVTALLFLIFGDALSALVGVKWGRIKIGQKSLEGSLAFLAGCFLIAVILKYTYLGLELRVAFWGAFAAALAELAPLPVNDNLSIPLCSSLVMAVLV